MAEKNIVPARVIVSEENTVIENADSVSNLSETEVTVRLKGKMLIISGDGIIISSLEEGRIVLSGRINSVTFA